jgi:ribosomal protein S2
MKEHIKTEIRFCEENNFEKNESENFIYISKNGNHLINLPSILEEYKEWMISKKIIKKIQ